MKNPYSELTHKYTDSYIAKKLFISTAYFQKLRYGVQKSKKCLERMLELIEREKKEGKI